MEVATEIRKLEKDAYHKVAFAFYAGEKMTHDKERILAQLRKKWEIYKHPKART